MSYKKVITTEETFEFDYPPTQTMSTVVPMMPPRMPMPGPGMVLPPPPPNWGNVGNTMPNTAAKLSSIFTNVQPQNTPAGIDLRLTSIDAWNAIMNYIRSGIVSIIGSLPDAEYIRAQESSATKLFKDTLFSYYGTKLLLNDALDKYITSLINLVVAKKSGTGVENAIAQAKNYSENLAAQLSALSFGPLSTPDLALNMKNLLSSITENIEKQIDARIASDWAEDASRLHDLYVMMTTGERNGPSGLAEIISNIIITSNTSRFPV